MPQGSRANYSPANLAKSMESFHFMLNGRLPQEFSLCNMTFIYDTIIGIHETGDDPHTRVISRTHPACTEELAVQKIKLL